MGKKPKPIFELRIGPLDKKNGEKEDGGNMCAQIKQNCFSVSVVMVALIVMVVAMVCSIRLVTIGLTHQIILC